MKNLSKFERLSCEAYVLWPLDYGRGRWYYTNRVVVESRNELKSWRKRARILVVPSSSPPIF